MYKKIYLDDPDIGESEKRHLNKAVDSGYVSTIGPFVPRFEERFAGLIGAKKAVSTQNGTAAIHIALYELGIGRNDEVIVPALTFIATVNPIVYVGAKPVFADVEATTWNIDPKEIEKNITRKTKAIIPVHLYGNPCNMDEIMKIARRHDLRVIEDATESLGAKYRTKYTGTFGDLGCFSFNGNKIITTGGGGMVAGNDTGRMNHIKFLVNQARDESKNYYHPEIGFNYRMTNLEAAMGLAQLEKLKLFLKRKKEFYAIYREMLGSVPFIKFQEELEKAENSRWLTCIMFDRLLDIGVLQRKLRSENVPTRRIFMPVTEFPHHKRSMRSPLTNSCHIYDRGLCLPASTLNSKDDIYRVCKAIITRVKGL